MSQFLRLHTTHHAQNFIFLKLGYTFFVCLESDNLICYTIISFDKTFGAHLFVSSLEEKKKDVSLYDHRFFQFWNKGLKTFILELFLRYLLNQIDLLFL